MGRHDVYMNVYYGVATISRLLKIIGLFCRISSLLQGSFARETHNFEASTHRSHPIRRTPHPKSSTPSLSQFICTYICIHTYTGWYDVSVNTYREKKKHSKFPPQILNPLSVSMYMYIYMYIYTGWYDISVNIYQEKKPTQNLNLLVYFCQTKCCLTQHFVVGIGWLRLVGSLKL